MAPSIINQIPNHQLEREAERVIEALFDGYRAVKVYEAYAAGRSGAGVYEVLAQRGFNDHELPAIVKIDEVSMIAQEFKAYQEQIENRLPNAAEIESDPVYPPGNQLAGLRYKLAGQGITTISSLSKFIHTHTLPEIERVFERIFIVMTRLWKNQQATEPSYRLDDCFDHFFPANLVIEVATPSSFEIPYLSPNTLEETELQVGDYLQLNEFLIVERSTLRQELELTTVKPTRPYRINLEQVPNASHYNVGDKLMRPLLGRVIQTRHNLFLEKVSHLFGQNFCEKSSLSIGDGITLPNPLHSYQQLMTKRHDVELGSVHGDLHFHNLVVSLPDHQITVIDFGKTHKDFVLRDLLYMDMTVIETLADAFDEGNLPLTLYRFYERLIPSANKKHLDLSGLSEEQAKALFIIWQLRQQAWKLLPDRSDAYYDGLVLTLFGSLKFASNSDHIRRLLFWSAAIHLQLRGAELVQPPLAEQPNIGKDAKPPQPVIVTPPPKELLNIWTDILMESPTMANQNMRNDVVNELPAAISGAAQRRSAARVDIRNILRACFNYPDGHNAFINALVEIEGETLIVQRLRATLTQ